MVAPVGSFFLAVDAAVAAKEEVDNDGEGARFEFGRLLLLISLLPKPPFLYFVHQPSPLALSLSSPSLSLRFFLLRCFSFCFVPEP